MGSIPTPGTIKAPLAQLVERSLGKTEVASSILAVSTKLAFEALAVMQQFCKLQKRVRLPKEAPLASPEYRRAYYEKRLEMYRAYLGGKCERCGSTENLEFDHIEPGSREFSVTERHDQSWVVIKPELDKCQLLCFECHVSKSIECGEIPPRQVHGTHGMYRHRGCRCSVCREANRVRNLKYKRRNSSVTEHGLGKTETMV